MTEQDKPKSALDELFEGIQIIAASDTQEPSVTSMQIPVSVPVPAQETTQTLAQAPTTSPCQVSTSASTSVPTPTMTRTPAYQYRPGFQPPRKSQFPGKENQSFSFNLTATGRELLKSGSTKQNISQGDYVEKLLRLQAMRGPIVLATKKSTGEKGGAKSFYFGKNRGITTAVCITPTARRIAEALVQSARETCADGRSTKHTRISRGDLIEFLLRQQADIS